MTEGLTIRPEPFESLDVQRALAQYVAELAEHFPEGFRPGGGVPPAEDDFTPPKGVFLLVRLAGEAMGCGGLRTESDGTAEIPACNDNPHAAYWFEKTLR